MAQNFDAAAATATYLAQLPPEAHAKATAYTHGGHWLLLWGALVAVLVSFLIVRSGVLVKLRHRFEGRRNRPLLVSYWVSGLYIVIDAVLSLPWAVYSDWWRPKQYGLTSQAFSGWLIEGAISLVITGLIGGLFFAALYALIRKAPRTWWLWSGGLTAAFIAIGMLLGPLFIEPIFNKYTPAPAGPVRDEVVAMARQVGVPSDKIFVYDGSKQSNAYTANVSGLFGSARVAMSDTMFKKGADIAEVRGVVGHEMGHYAHHHSLWIAGVMSLLAVAAFFLVDRLFAPAARLLGADGVRGLSDPAGLPVLSAVITVLFLLATPVISSLIRIAESDADHYSLARFNEPDGLAKALVKTIEYRAATPGRLEEIIFYDHPAVGRRIQRAMEWKAAHPEPASTAALDAAARAAFVGRMVELSAPAPAGQGPLILKSDGSWFQRYDFGSGQGKYAITGGRLCLSADGGAPNCREVVRVGDGWALRGEDGVAAPVVLKPIEDRAG
ncbi:M48 family metallopeptidase [Caulobacter hibisci]|uniref:M48 family metallopeptidase n=1 Tax=Caulobacter hibisci TaxID=2035993 RepID=A0ABS0SXK6_9CAUL|nr:M48 family metallopeptidase [Caulobacter hibisci]MBI1684377.1 M48 family metallopeptidase [Caulobacter hibisci]